MPPPPPTTESLASAHPSLHAARRPIHLVHACVRQWAHPIAASGLSPHPTSLSADQSEAPLALLHVFQTPFSACHTETACSHLQAIHCKPSWQSVPPPPPTMEHRLPWPLFTCAAPRLPHTLPSLLLQLQPKYQHPAPRRRTNFLRFNNPCTAETARSARPPLQPGGNTEHCLRRASPSSHPLASPGLTLPNLAEAKEPSAPEQVDSCVKEYPLDHCQHWQHWNHG